MPVWEEIWNMGQRSLAPIWWVILAIVILAVLGAGLLLMPRVLSATTYVPPTSTPTEVPPTSQPATVPSEGDEPPATTEPPAPLPTSSLRSAPDFTLPGAHGTSVTLSEELAEGPVVVVFFPRVGG
jgi:hypothetical protein